MKTGIIVIFRLQKGTRNVVLSKFMQKFYGQDSTSHKGKYRFHRHGILDDIPHRKFIRGVIVIREEDVVSVERVLKDYDAIYYIRHVVLTRDDEAVLKENKRAGIK